MRINTSFMYGIFLRIKYKCSPVYDLHIARDMNSREGIVTGDYNALHTLVNNHNTPQGKSTHAIRRISQHLQRVDSIGQWNSKNPVNTKLLSTDSLDVLFICRDA
jgi:hypothetical protein